MQHRIPKGLISKIHKAHQQYMMQQFNKHVHKVMEMCTPGSMHGNAIMMNMEKKCRKKKHRLPERDCRVRKTH